VSRILCLGTSTVAQLPTWRLACHWPAAGLPLATALASTATAPPWPPHSTPLRPVRLDGRGSTCGWILALAPWQLDRCLPAPHPMLAAPGTCMETYQLVLPDDTCSWNHRHRPQLTRADAPFSSTDRIQTGAPRRALLAGDIAIAPVPHDLPEHPLARRPVILVHLLHRRAALCARRCSCHGRGARAQTMGLCSLRPPVTVSRPSLASPKTRTATGHRHGLDMSGRHRRTRGYDATLMLFLLRSFNADRFFSRALPTSSRT